MTKTSRLQLKKPVIGSTDEGTDVNSNLDKIDEAVIEDQVASSASKDKSRKKGILFFLTLFKIQLHRTEETGICKTYFRNAQS